MEGRFVVPRAFFTHIPAQAAPRRSVERTVAVVATTQTAVCRAFPLIQLKGWEMQAGAEGRHF